MAFCGQETGRERGRKVQENERAQYGRQDGEKQRKKREEERVWIGCPCACRGRYMNVCMCAM